MSDICPYDAPELADKILEDLDDLCNELGLTFFLYAGVCLGFHREKDYIYLDNDIDVIVIANETEYQSLISGLVRLGFEQSPLAELYHLRRDNMLLDLRRADRGSLYTVPAGATSKSYTFREFDTVTHYGRTYRIPSPVDHYLTHSYGSWWIPRLKNE